jgi:negative regulator of sigma E activity
MVAWALRVTMMALAACAMLAAIVMLPPPARPQKQSKLLPFGQWPNGP